MNCSRSVAIIRNSKFTIAELFCMGGFYVRSPKACRTPAPPAALTGRSRLPAQLACHRWYPRTQ